MTEPRKLTFEFAFSGKNVRPWLFATHGFGRVLFPLKEQAHLRMYPFGYTQLESGQNIIENVLVSVEDA